MGSKYRIRTKEVRTFPLMLIDFTDYYINNTFEFIITLIKKRKVLMFATKNFN